MYIRTVLLPLCAAMLAACAPGDQVSSISPARGYSVLSAREVTTLRLEPAGHLRFAAGRVAPPTKYRKFRVHNRRSYALDNYDPFIKVYSETGEFLHQIGKKGSGPGELEIPTSFAFVGDEVWVVDAARAGQASVFGADGTFRRIATLASAGPAFDVAEYGGRIAVASLGSVQPEKDGAEFVQLFDGQGGIVRKGCLRDKEFIESLRSERMLSMTPMTHVAAGANALYCIQQTSPVVQVLDGAAPRSSRLAPPFYRAPVEQAPVLNQKKIFEYLSTWTSHDEIYALADGYASVYSTWNLEAGEPRFSLFVCRARPAAPACGVIEDIPQPILISPDGSVYVDEGEVSTNGPTQVGLYRLSGWEAAGRT